MKTYFSYRKTNEYFGGKNFMARRSGAGSVVIGNSSATVVIEDYENPNELSPGAVAIGSIAASVKLGNYENPNPLSPGTVAMATYSAPLQLMNFEGTNGSESLYSED